MTRWSVGVVAVLGACASPVKKPSAPDGAGAGSAAPSAAAAVVAVAMPDGKPGIGFDDLRWSAASKRVLVPGGRSGKLDLIDPATRAVTAIGGFSAGASFGGGHDDGITSVDEGHGVLLVTDRTSGELDVVDPTSATIVARAKLGGGPDYVRWVGATEEIWITEPDKEQIEIFQLGAGGASPKRVAVIAVPGGPESLVVDDAAKRAYTHLWHGQSVALDVTTRKPVWTVKNGCGGSRGIAVDAAHGWLIAACAEGKVALLSTADGHVLSELPVAGLGGVDVIGYARGHIAVAGTAGQVAIVGTKDGRLVELGRVAVPGGDSCATSDDVGHAWVCAPASGSMVEVTDAW